MPRELDTGSTNSDNAQQEIVSFDPDDPENPFNWSYVSRSCGIAFTRPLFVDSKQRKKQFIVVIGVLAILNSTFDSSLTSGAIQYIADDLQVSQDIQHVLPISLYLVGYVLGPLLFSPLSETYGRRIVLIPTFILLIAFTAACAAARSWSSFLIFRLICGINASSSIAITSGIYADILEDPEARGRAIAFYISVR